MVRRMPAPSSAGVDDPARNPTDPVGGARSRGFQVVRPTVLTRRGTPDDPGWQSCGVCYGFPKSTAWRRAMFS